MSRTVELPGEFLPFLSVSLHAKVPSYVDRVLVDRGSIVKQGDLLVEMSAPEMAAQIAEAQSKVQAAEADRLQAEAQLAAAQSTYDRMKQAAETPGAIAGNELIQAEKQVDAAKALLNSRLQASRATESAVRSLQDLQGYLKITAPFDGVVTDRLVHPGALVGPGNDIALLVIQQVSHLRLVVPVPEEDVSGIMNGARRSLPGPRLAGTNLLRDHRAHFACARSEDAHHGDRAGRDESRWIVGSRYVSDREMAGPPLAALAFRAKDERGHHDRAHVRDSGSAMDMRNGWMSRKALTEGDLVEVIGNLKPGDMVVRRATDETREGSPMLAAKSKKQE